MISILQVRTIGLPPLLLKMLEHTVLATTTVLLEYDDQPLAARGALLFLLLPFSFCSSSQQQN